jgi:hypothetical protein
VRALLRARYQCHLAAMMAPQSFLTITLETPSFSGKINLDHPFPGRIFKKLKEETKKQN